MPRWKIHYEEDGIARTYECDADVSSLDDYSAAALLIKHVSPESVIVNLGTPVQMAPLRLLEARGYSIKRIEQVGSSLP